MNYKEYLLEQDEHLGSYASTKKWMIKKLGKRALDIYDDLMKSTSVGSIEHIRNLVNNGKGSQINRYLSLWKAAQRENDTKHPIKSGPAKKAFNKFIAFTVHK